ncbi:MAG TPA: family 43 glycosylhydrolase, partial [Chitinophagaceae bacterium]|nr:family 43 glycosylhydrolase [Chitinophagaceae bacterium]
MKSMLKNVIVLFFLNSMTAYGQQPLKNESLNYQQVNTYMNPVLPGDHPDPTLIRIGKDFYHCGSSFHFNPYLPIYHSTDMVHWEI